MNSLRLLALLSIVATASAGCKPAAPPLVADLDTLRSPPAGTVVGSVSPYGSDMWLGIPYAQPPVGPLRWRAPRPLAAWDGTREALTNGSSCVQFSSPLGGIDGPQGTLGGTEDCLYVNVWAPRRDAAATERLPVMVWIHGGGNTIGAAGFYDGGRLAAEYDVVVVTINYRLGPFGWFRHAALRGDDASPEDRSGNFGTLDHIRALEWVRDNIDAFGGDAGNVTIFGESAGGLNVMALLVAPPAAGLFHRAIVQSGVPLTFTAAEAENFADATPAGNANSSQEALARMLQAAGVRGDRAGARQYIEATNPETLERFLRERSPAEIMAAYPAPGRSGMIPLPKVFEDGHVLPAESIMERLARADGHHAVPVMLGTTRDENKLFMFIDDEWVWHIFGVYPRLREPSLYDLNAEYMAKMWKAYGADEPARRLVAAGRERVFVYRFDWDELPRRFGVDLARLLGASHGFEIPFVFGHFDLGREGNMLFTQANLAGREELAGRMMSYWTEFAYRGDPGRGRDGTLPPWQAWGDGDFLVLDTDAGGGVRLARDTVTRPGVVAALGADERLDAPRERCRILRSLALWSWGFDRDDYVEAWDGACAAYPIDAFPWS